MFLYTRALISDLRSFQITLKLLSVFYTSFQQRKEARHVRLKFLQCVPQFYKEVIDMSIIWFFKIQAVS